jgi:hypothetical protein
VFRDWLSSVTRKKGFDLAFEVRTISLKYNIDIGSLMYRKGCGSFQFKIPWTCSLVAQELRESGTLNCMCVAVHKHETPPSFKNSQRETTSALEQKALPLPFIFIIYEESGSNSEHDHFGVQKAVLNLKKTLTAIK